MTRRRKIVLAMLAMCLATSGIGAWYWSKRGPIVRALVKDLRAGARARGAEKPFERFLELRYGPLTEATNRQNAFRGFFDTAHMEGMRRLVGFMDEGERKTNIASTANWIATYRETMTEEEKAALADWMRSTEGKATLQRASAAYRSRDIKYRSATEPVIKELMTTLGQLHGAEQ